jgi:hypothetical protein
MQRLDDRVRRWAPGRWQAAGPRGLPRFEAAYALAVELAQLARQAGNAAPGEPPPRVAPHAIADQLVVLTLEFTAAPEAAALSGTATAALERALENL